MNASDAGSEPYVSVRKQLLGFQTGNCGIIATAAVVVALALYRQRASGPSRTSVSAEVEDWVSAEFEGWVAAEVEEHGLVSESRVA